MTTPQDPDGLTAPSFDVPAAGPEPHAATPIAPPTSLDGADAAASAPARARSSVGTYAALAAAGLVIGAAGTWALGSLDGTAVAGTVDRAGAGAQDAGRAGQGPGDQRHGMAPPGTSDGSAASGSTGSGQAWTPPGTSSQQGQGQPGQQGGMAAPPGGMGTGNGQGPMGTSGGS